MPKEKAIVNISFGCFKRAIPIKFFIAWKPEQNPETGLMQYG